MSPTRIPTSLRNAPSGFTPEELARKRAEIGAYAWHHHGYLFVDILDPSLNPDLRARAEAEGNKRFGKRNAPPGRGKSTL